MNRMWLLSLGLILILSFGCTEQQPQSTETQADNSPQTLEELKNQTGEGSEYAKCLDEVDKNEIRWEECRVAKLQELGYTDGVNCIKNYTNPVCRHDCPVFPDDAHCEALTDLGEYSECLNESLRVYEDCLDLYSAAIDRYNADVQAKRECNEEIDLMALTKIDCLKLK